MSQHTLGKDLVWVPFEQVPHQGHTSYEDGRHSPADEAQWREDGIV